MDEKILETMREVINQHSKTLKQISDALGKMNFEIDYLKSAVLNIKYEMNKKKEGTKGFENLFGDLFGKEAFKK